MSSYESNTVNARNPIVRYTHRNRIKRSVELACHKRGGGRVLDYGCGSGIFVSLLNSLEFETAIGYEPYMKERCKEELPVYSDLEEINNNGPYSLITLFETIEHLSENEVCAFLDVCEKNLLKSGGVLISAPIEVGPALILKELNRSVFKFRHSEHSFMEFLKASVFGIAARRAEHIKYSHKGFDFRSAIKFLKLNGWNVEILCFGPLPIATWYGNSQVYLWVTKRIYAPIL